VPNCGKNDRTDRQEITLQHRSVTDIFAWWKLSSSWQYLWGRFNIWV